MSTFNIAWTVSGTTTVEADTEGDATRKVAEQLEAAGLEGGAYAAAAAEGGQNAPLRHIFDGNPGDIPG